MQHFPKPQFTFLSQSLLPKHPIPPLDPSRTCVITSPLGAQLLCHAGAVPQRPAFPYLPPPLGHKSPPAKITLGQESLQEPWDTKDWWNGTQNTASSHGSWHHHQAAALCPHSVSLSAAAPGTVAAPRNESQELQRLHAAHRDAQEAAIPAQHATHEASFPSLLHPAPGTTHHKACTRASCLGCSAKKKQDLGAVWKEERSFSSRMQNRSRHLCERSKRTHFPLCSLFYRSSPESDLQAGFEEADCDFWHPTARFAAPNSRAWLRAFSAEQ